MQMLVYEFMPSGTLRDRLSGILLVFVLLSSFFNHHIALLFSRKNKQNNLLFLFLSLICKYKSEVLMDINNLAWKIFFLFVSSFLLVFLLCRT